MRRKGSRASEYSIVPHNIEDVGSRRLKTIGAISLIWNSIEGAVDVALGLALEQPEPMWLEITSRINGLEGKIELIKAAAKYRYGMPEPERTIMAHALGFVWEHKKYRDAVIHVKVLDPSSPVAPTTERKGKVDEVLITREALVALYKRLDAALQEIDKVADIFGNLGLAHGRIVKERSVSDKQLALQQVKSGFARLQALQKNRANLPPLPKFPDELLAPPKMEEPKAPPG